MIFYTHIVDMENKDIYKIFYGILLSTHSGKLDKDLP